MEFISNNSELALASLLFARLFRNIRIERTDKQGKSSWLTVQCVFGQRSRILKSFENAERKSMYRLPMIVINRTGYSRQGDRLNSLHNEVKYEITSKNRNLQFLTPVPIDINFEVSVIAKYPSDIDKIASNFMVFFNSNIYVSQEHPKFEGVKLHNEVIMQDSVSEEHPDEFDGSQDDITTSTFSFTFKTYLFGGTTKAKKAKAQAVSSVTSTFVSSYVYEFKDDDEVRSYLSVDQHSKLSTTLTSEVTTQVTSLVDTSSDTYDDGIPKIQSLDFGFYAVPRKYDIESYIMSVDSGLIAEHKHYTRPAYISSGSYVSNYASAEVWLDEGVDEVCTLTSLTPVDDYYDHVDNWCTLAPYVDRILWKIDEGSLCAFPDNVRPYRCPDFGELSVLDL